MSAREADARAWRAYRYHSLKRFHGPVSSCRVVQVLCELTCFPLSGEYIVSMLEGSLVKGNNDSYECILYDVGLTCS